MAPNVLDVGLERLGLRHDVRDAFVLVSHGHGSRAWDPMAAFA